MTTPDEARGEARGEGWSAEAGIPEDEVGLLTRVVRLTMLVTRVLDGLVEPHGIGLPDYLVLASIRRGVTSPAALCRVLGRTTGGMSLTLDRLTDAGWVERRPDPGDRRRIVVGLTADGRATAEAVNRALHRWEADLGLDPGERDAVERALVAVTDVVEQAPTGPGVAGGR